MPLGLYKRFEIDVLDSSAKTGDESVVSPRISSQISFPAAAICGQTTKIVNLTVAALTMAPGAGECSSDPGAKRAGYRPES
jgi:hypothetical protein